MQSVCDISLLLSKMGTELPVDLWEKIVGNLPPPPPKMVPAIVFELKECERAAIHISKAISDEEREILVDGNHFLKWEKGPYIGNIHPPKVDMSWSISDTSFGAARTLCIRAFMLGYRFQDPNSATTYRLGKGIACMVK